MKYMPPNYFQSTFSSIILVSLSLLFLPATLSLSVFALVYGVLTGSLISFTREDTETKRESVLITGARANKALTLIRAFKRANYRVIVAEEEEWRFCCARFSLAVDAFYTLPSPRSPSGTQPYIDAIKRIVQDEEVVFWVPCSTVHATMEDAEAARQIRQLDLGGGSNSYCETFIPHPDLTATIHWKGKLNNLLVELGIPVPNSKVVTTTAQALDFIYSPTTLEKGYQYILKCISLDDLGRDNMTLLPLSTRADTREHLKKMPTPISKEIPFMVQRYLRGVEYCTHVAARDGDIVAFVACPSNPLLMRYVDARNLGDEGKRRSAEMEAWVRDFLQKWKHKLGSEGKEGWQAELTGHFSFDFIYDENDEKWYPLACNAVRDTSYFKAAQQLMDPGHDILIACAYCHNFAVRHSDPRGIIHNEALCGRYSSIISTSEGVFSSVVVSTRLTYLDNPVFASLASPELDT